MAKKFSSLHSCFKGFASIPDNPNHNRELFIEAVKQAAVSGVIEQTYARLPEAVRKEFSFASFERNVGKVQS